MFPDGNQLVQRLVHQLGQQVRVQLTPQLTPHLGLQMGLRVTPQVTPRMNQDVATLSSVQIGHRIKATRQNQLLRPKYLHVCLSVLDTIFCPGDSRRLSTHDSPNLQIDLPKPCQTILRQIQNTPSFPAALSSHF